MKLFAPEGAAPPSPGPWTEARLRRAMANEEVLTAVVHRCDAAHMLHLRLGGIRCRIPLAEAALGPGGGPPRAAAAAACVGRPVCFHVTALTEDEAGLCALGSRRAVQAEALAAYLAGLRPGDILPGVVTGLAHFGAFCDLGQGVTGLLPAGRIAVSHTRDAAERFRPGQRLYAVVQSTEGGRITLSHRELLGTWRDNAARFAPGQVVPGIARSVMPYGTFIELTPNLSGLCEAEPRLEPSERVSVRIKSIQPERRKIKLAVVHRLPPSAAPPSYRYFRREGHMDFWQYAPALREKAPILTCF